VSARRVGAAALLAALAGACSRAPDGPRSLIVVTLDTTRADHLSSYGYPQPLTPRLDALAARGVRFERAYAPMPQTLPSHATLFTGLYPRQHGALENYFVLGDEQTTLAEELAGRGWETAAFVGSLALHRDTGIDQGFATFDQPPEPTVENPWHPAERPARAVTDAALAWAAARDRGGPYLLWVHYYDPHGPYEPPEDALERVSLGQVAELVGDHPLLGRRRAQREELVTLWRRYAAEVAEVDAQVGRLLDGLEDLEMLDDAAVLVVGDHGEGLYEHGIKGHGIAVWEEQVRVPLVVAAPDGALAGTTVPEPVPMTALRDVMRALVDPGHRSGLWARLLAGRAPPPDPVFVERPHYTEERAEWRRIPQGERGELVGVVVGASKAIRGVDGRVTTYDLEADAEELAPRRDAPGAEGLVSLIAAFLERHAVDAEAPELDPERRAQLEQLGYN